MTIQVFKPGPRWPCRELCPLCRYLESYQPASDVDMGTIDNYASDVYWCNQHPSGNGTAPWKGTIIANDPQVLATPWMIRINSFEGNNWYEHLHEGREGVSGEFRPWLMRVLIHHRLMDLPEPVRRSRRTHRSPWPGTTSTSWSNYYRWTEVEP